MISDARNRSGIEANQIRTDTDITRYLNESGYFLTGKILAEHPDATFLYKTGTISAVNGTSVYDLPNDCFQPYLFRVTVNGERVNIPRSDIDELDIETSNLGWDTTGVRPTHRLMGYAATFTGPQVKFMPTPTASYTVTVHYIPHLPFAINDSGFTRLEDMSDTAKHVFMSEWGWEEFIVLHTAIKLKHDQDEDAVFLERELGAWWDVISNQIKSRTTTEAPQVRDAYTGWTDNDTSRWYR